MAVQEPRKASILGGPGPPPQGCSPRSLGLRRHRADRDGGFSQLSALERFSIFWASGALLVATAGFPSKFWSERTPGWIQGSSFDPPTPTSSRRENITTGGSCQFSDSGCPQRARADEKRLGAKDRSRGEPPGLRGCPRGHGRIPLRNSGPNAPMDRSRCRSLPQGGQASSRRENITTGGFFAIFGLWGALGPSRNDSG